MQIFTHSPFISFFTLFFNRPKGRGIYPKGIKRNETAKSFKSDFHKNFLKEKIYTLGRKIKKITQENIKKYQLPGRPAKGALERVTALGETTLALGARWFWAGSSVS
jgi:hypothetical protein